MGADHVFALASTSAEERLQAVRDRTHGEGVDVVIEAAGSARAIEEGVTLVRDGGRYVIAGHYTDVGPSTHQRAPAHQSQAPRDSRLLGQRVPAFPRGDRDPRRPTATFRGATSAPGPIRSRRSTRRSTTPRPCGSRRRWWIRGRDKRPGLGVRDRGSEIANSEADRTLNRRTVNRRTRTAEPRVPSQRMRHTKIIATIGPASAQPRSARRARHRRRRRVPAQLLARHARLARRDLRAHPRDRVERRPSRRHHAGPERTEDPHRPARRRSTAAARGRRVAGPWRGQRPVPARAYLHALRRARAIRRSRATVCCSTMGASS